MIDESIVRRVLGSYGFIESTIEWARPLGAGTKNSSYLVRADGHTWVLKSVAGSPPARRACLAVALETRLGEAGFPVAPLRRSASGQALVKDGRTHFTLHAWVEGQQETISERDELLGRHPELVERLASALGAMHQIGSQLDRGDLELPAITAESLLRAPSLSLRRLHRPRRHAPVLSPWHALRLRREKSDFDQWIIEALPHVAQEAARISRYSVGRLLRQSEAILIHNDLNWENLIFDSERRLLAILDFDNMTRAPRIIELGAATVTLIGTDRRLVDEFVGVYEDLSHVATDREALAYAMSLKCVQSILNAVTIYLRGGSRDPERLEAWCRHLYESMDELRSRRAT